MSLQASRTAFPRVTATATLAIASILSAHAVQNSSAANSPRAIAPGTPSATMISSFESSAAIQRPAMVTYLAKTYLTTSGATDGSYAVGVDVPVSATTHPAVSIFPASKVNLSASGGIAFDINNTSASALTFTVKLIDARGNYAERPATLAAGDSGTYRVGSEVQLDSSTYGMKALPNPYKGMTTLQPWFVGAFDPTQITEVRIYVRTPQVQYSYTLDNMRLLPAFDLTSYLTGMVDRFGQNGKDLWQNKMTSGTQFSSRLAAEQADLQANPSPSNQDEYGGYLGAPAQAATGYFRTQKVNGRWWLVDPKGRLFFSAGINGVAPSAPTAIGNRSWMTTLDASTGATVKSRATAPATYDYYANNLVSKYGPDISEWDQSAQTRLRSWGFNTFGAWSDPDLYDSKKTSFVVVAGTQSGSAHQVSTGYDYWRKLPDPFDPVFSDDVTKAMAKQTWKISDPSRCVGFMVDNELSWIGTGSTATWGIAYGVMRDSATSSPAKKAFLSQLTAKYGTISRLNSAWGKTYASWTTLNPALELPATPNAAQKADMEAFVLSFARKYFTTVRAGVKAAVPNALYLGCRFANYTPQVLQAADESCDVITFNYYANQFNAADFAFTQSLTKPCMISEFSFGATDRGLPYPGLIGTSSQTSRADGMSDYVRNVAKMPNFVGVHWFQYTDEPVLGRPTDGANGNIGMVDVTDTPYTEMIAAARKVNAAIYNLHLGG